MLPSDMATRYRATTARLNYVASDRVDIQYAVKECSRHMSSPKESHWKILKRTAKHLVRRPRLVMHSDGTEPAKSTSGGIITIRSHVIKSYSRQQKTVALSRAEAELHAMVAASAETLGIASLLRDMDVDEIGVVYADPSAALDIS